MSPRSLLPVPRSPAVGYSLHPVRWRRATTGPARRASAPVPRTSGRDAGTPRAPGRPVAGPPPARPGRRRLSPAPASAPFAGTPRTFVPGPDAGPRLRGRLLLGLDHRRPGPAGKIGPVLRVALGPLDPLPRGFRRGLPGVGRFAGDAPFGTGLRLGGRGAGFRGNL